MREDMCSEGRGHGGVWGKNITGSGKSRCKGPGVGVMCLRSNEEACVARDK